MILLGDGDNVRKHIDNLLLSENFTKLAMLSNGLDTAVKEIAAIATNEHDAEIIFAAGDDICMIIECDNINEFIQKLQNIFSNRTGLSMTFGKGDKIEGALIDLKRNKSLELETRKNLPATVGL